MARGWGWALGVGLAAALGSGCGSCNKADEAKSADAAVAVAKVPPPDDLLAEGVVVTPNATWRKLQAGIGGAIGLMPQTAGSVVASLAGIDLALGAELDGTAPAYVTLAGDPEDPTWAVAIKMVEERKVRDVLLGAEGAKYTGKDEGGLTVLSSKTPGMEAIGLAIDGSGYVVVAKNDAAVRSLGPYTARNLPTMPAPNAAVRLDVTPKALSGKVRAALEKRWRALAVDLLAADAKMREEHGGRAPDFADPKALVGIVDTIVQKKLSALSSLTKLTIAMDAEAEDVHVRAEAEGPVADGGLAPMTVGDVAPLLDVPEDTVLAILTRSQGAERASDAKEVEDALTASLGARLPEADAKKLHSAVDDFAKGRGDVLTVVGLVGDRGKGLALRTEAKDDAARAVGSLADLARSPAFKEPLRIKAAQRTTGEAPAVGKCDVLDVTLEGRGKGPDTKVGLAWTVEGGKLTAALGVEPLDLVARAARPAKKLADTKALVSYVGAVGKDASFVFFAQPFLADARHPPAPAPALVAWGVAPGGDGKRWARLDVSDKVLREVLKKQLGL